MSLLGDKEDARVEKSDGRVVGPYNALFAGSTIFILDPKADIEEGDAVLRALPNGKDERSFVTKATFYQQDVGSMGAHYQVKFRKGGESPSQKPTQNINITGAGSVQIGDYNTQNIINSFEALVKKIQSAEASDAEKAEAQGLLKRLLEHPLVVSVLGAAAGSVIG
jgi:hypothetical protein